MNATIFVARRRSGTRWWAPRASYAIRDVPPGTVPAAHLEPSSARPRRSSSRSGAARDRRHRRRRGRHALTGHVAAHAPDRDPGRDGERWRSRWRSCSQDRTLARDLAPCGLGAAGALRRRPRTGWSTRTWPWSRGATARSRARRSCARTSRSRIRRPSPTTRRTCSGTSARARILFIDAHGRTVAAVGDASLDPPRARSHERSAGRRRRASCTRSRAFRSAAGATRSAGWWRSSRVEPGTLARVGRAVRAAVTLGGGDPVDGESLRVPGPRPVRRRVAARRVAARRGARGAAALARAPADRGRARAARRARRRASCSRAGWSPAMRDAAAVRPIGSAAATSPPGSRSRGATRSGELSRAVERDGEPARDGLRDRCGASTASWSRPRRRGRRGREPREERVPGQHEPRDPHADDRGAGLSRSSCSKAKPRATSAARWYRRTCAATAPTCSQLIDGILDLSRVEAGELEHPTEPAGCAAWSRTPPRRSRRRRSRRASSSASRSTRTAPRRCETDPVRLRQVLVNLLQNALKFTEHGSVSLWVGAATRPRHASASRCATPASASRRRTAAADLRRPSRRPTPRTRAATAASASGSRSRSGSSPCSAASLDVSSDVGRGSELPAHAARAGLRAPDESEPGAARRARRAPAIRPGARDRFSGGGRPRQPAPDPRAPAPGSRSSSSSSRTACRQWTRRSRALDSARPSTLVLMDMQMPVMDGYEATRRAALAGVRRADRRAHRARDVGPTASRCLEAGCDDYLSKPVDRAALFDAVARYTERKDTDGANGLDSGACGLPIDYARLRLAARSASLLAGLAQERSLARPRAFRCLVLVSAACGLPAASGWSSSTATAS
mgnify:CR=1 FL=1